MEGTLLENTFFALHCIRLIEFFKVDSKRKIYIKIMNGMSNFQ